MVMPLGLLRWFKSSKCVGKGIGVIVKIHGGLDLGERQRWRRCETLDKCPSEERRLRRRKTYVAQPEGLASPPHLKRWINLGPEKACVPQKASLKRPSCLKRLVPDKADFSPV